MRAALFLAGLFLAGFAQAEIGSVSEFNGAAIIKRGNATITVAKGTLIETNDKVETKNGKVKITFKDNTTVNVTESSTLVIDDFVYDPKSGAGKLNLKAAAGTVRYVSGNIAHNNPNAVNIKTPTAAIAVRGTDFVMSVNETGGSMIMLMPTCELEQNVNLKGLTCGSGAIDVETPAGIVKMNRPYQATLVETAANPPSPPITVALNGMAIGNNLMINPPKTMSGASIIAAARAAAIATGDAKKSDNRDKKEDKEDKEDNKEERQHAASNKDGGPKSQRQGRSANEGDEDPANRTKVGVDVAGSLKASGVSIGDAGTENPNVRKIYKDKSETQQVGWGYESLSSNGNNYASIGLNIDTKVLVVVTQDRVTDAYNFNLQSTKSYGTIIINQTYR